TPSREVLIAKLMGSMNSPISALARTLQALVDNGVEPCDIKVEKEEAPAEVEAAPAEAVEEAPEAPAAE
ncbi:MAG: 50S ribosomal protein L10, partial [Clostridia bacterium]|nr:50S ribosomal protein L10 [Clostridia bacterium]